MTFPLISTAAAIFVAIQEQNEMRRKSPVEEERGIDAEMSSIDKNRKQSYPKANT